MDGQKKDTHRSHHHHIWRQGLRVDGQLVNEKTEKGYSLFPPEIEYIEYLSEI